MDLRIIKDNIAEIETGTNTVEDLIRGGAGLSEAELAATDGAICPHETGSLYPGDTIELHYVHTTASVTPGPTLGACLSESIGNPQLRVEAHEAALSEAFKDVVDGSGSRHAPAHVVKKPCGAGCEQAGRE